MAKCNIRNIAKIVLIHMKAASAIIKNGAIFVYRLYDVAHEINLKNAQAMLESQGVQRYRLKKDNLKTILFKDAPLMVSCREEVVSFPAQEKDLPCTVNIKVWAYGVISIGLRIQIPSGTTWKELVSLAEALEIGSNVDELALRKRDELVNTIKDSLKNPFTHSTFEDYTTYLIEEIQSEDDKERGVKKYPHDLLKTLAIAELLRAEPKKKLADSTKKSIEANLSQYTKEDLLIMDWNSALVMDFSKEKEYLDYVDLIEFSLAQLLELRIYDGLLDEKLDELYDSMERQQFNKVTEFYTRMSQESGKMYMEFSDVFERLDNSIKTAGDYYLAKVLKSADRRFGFDELKRSMSRKIESLSTLSRHCQEKVDSLIYERRNELEEENNRLSHRLELIVIILIMIEIALHVLGI